ncbi:MAG: MATE family efflux transporter [Fibrobacterales bacterium]
MNWLKKRYYREAGYKELLKVAFPLMISSGAFSLLMFIDRMFVSWYSSDALAAAMPAGALSFAFGCLFLGTGLYIGTFVSQYFGSKRPERIGPAVWQGLYLSAIGGFLMLFLIPLAPMVFNSFDHAPEVITLEISYFQVLCLGVFPMVAMAVFGGFYSGRGITKPVMWVNIYMLFINTPLDYLLVFGWGPIPEMGLFGAGIATVISQLIALVLFAWLVFRKKNNEEFNTLSGWRFDTDLFGRLIRYGLPSGVHMFIEIAGFTVFMIMIGFLGKEIQAASNIAFQIDIFGFIIIHSMAISVSIKVGQYIGAKQIDKAEISTYSGIQLGLMMALTLSFIYVTFPGPLVGLFGLRADPAEFAPIAKLATELLLFVAIYAVGDCVQLMFSSAIKGAGDTHFVMKYLGLFTVVVMIIPSIIIIKYLDGTIYAMWGLLTFFVFSLSIVYTIRYFGGKWKSMQVIEEEPVYIGDSEHR